MDLKIFTKQNIQAFIFIGVFIITLSSVIIPIASMKLSNTKIFIDKSKIQSPKKELIILTGRATAGTMQAFKFPRKRYIIITTNKLIIDSFNFS